MAGLAGEYPSFRGEGLDEEDSNTSEMLLVFDKGATTNTLDYVRSPFPALGDYGFGTP